MSWHWQEGRKSNQIITQLNRWYKFGWPRSREEFSWWVAGRFSNHPYAKAATSTYFRLDLVCTHSCQSLWYKKSSSNDWTTQTASSIESSYCDWSSYSIWQWISSSSWSWHLWLPQQIVFIWNEVVMIHFQQLSTHLLKLPQKVLVHKWLNQLVCSPVSWRECQCRLNFSVSKQTHRKARQLQLLRVHPREHSDKKDWMANYYAILGNLCPHILNK